MGIHGVVDWIHSKRLERKTVLVHCDAGASPPSGEAGPPMKWSRGFCCCLFFVVFFWLDGGRWAMFAFGVCKARS